MEGGNSVKGLESNDRLETIKEQKGVVLYLSKTQSIYHSHHPYLF